MTKPSHDKGSVLVELAIGLPLLLFVLLGVLELVMTANLHTRLQATAAIGMRVASASNDILGLGAGKIHPGPSLEQLRIIHQYLPEWAANAHISPAALSATDRTALDFILGYARTLFPKYTTPNGSAVPWSSPPHPAMDLRVPLLKQREIAIVPGSNWASGSRSIAACASTPAILMSEKAICVQYRAFIGESNI